MYTIVNHKILRYVDNYWVFCVEIILLLFMVWKIRFSEFFVNFFWAKTTNETVMSNVLTD